MLERPVSRTDGVGGYQFGARPRNRIAVTASATSASRNQMGSRRSRPRARIQVASSTRVAGSSMITVSRTAGLPARNNWPPDLGAVIAAAAMRIATCRTGSGANGVGVEASAAHAAVMVAAVWRVHQA